jgi:hypothetical protein
MTDISKRLRDSAQMLSTACPKPTVLITSSSIYVTVQTPTWPLRLEVEMKPLLERMRDSLAARNQRGKLIDAAMKEQS